MATETRHSDLGIQRLAVWKLTSDSDTATEYDMVKEINKAVMTITVTPAVTSAEQYAEDTTTEYFSQNIGGTIALEVTDLTSEEESLIYGSQIVNRVLVSNKDDMSNYLCVAYQTKRSDGLVNLYKVLKAVFPKSAKTHNTIQKSSVTFSTVSLNGEYVPVFSTGDDRYQLKAVNPKTDTNIINKWFTEALYKGEEE